MNKAYQLLDSGDGKKWERFGEVVLCRPCPQAIWRPEKEICADAEFSREQRWVYHKKLPSSWEVLVGGVLFKVALTEFGHLGLFPEHAPLWEAASHLFNQGGRFLNLFAYSGGASLALAKAGASVCHVDAAKGMLEWARENSALNGLEGAPIRWIVDDVLKFLKREQRRGSLYEGILLDPPTFGRGSRGEVFKVERDLVPLLELCRKLLSPQAKCLILSCHTPGFTPLVLRQLLEQVFQRPATSGEMLLSSPDTFSIPSGSFARVLFD